MMMGQLWQHIDCVIDKFVADNAEEAITPSSILWKKPVLYAQSQGQDTDKVLRGSKTIVSVQSIDDANTLVKALQDRLSCDDLLVRDQKTKKMRPFKLRIKIIECDPFHGEITLKKSDIPVTVHDLHVDDVCDLLTSIKDTDLTVIGMQLEKINNPDMQQVVAADMQKTVALIKENYASDVDKAKSLDTNKTYCVHYVKPYASSYRITYNDGKMRGRKQTAVGDVLIAVKGSKVVDSNRVTKFRSDIFSLRYFDNIAADLSTITVYNDIPHKSSKGT